MTVVPVPGTWSQPEHGHQSSPDIVTITESSYSCKLFKLNSQWKLVLQPTILMGKNKIKCFAKVNVFDSRDKSININEFSALCTALFKNEKGKPYPLDSQQISDLFMIFNVSGDGSMSMQEFVYCWNGWITKVRRRVSIIMALLELCFLDTLFFLK